MTLQVMFVGFVWICLVAGWRQFFFPFFWVTLDQFDPSVYYGITKQRGGLTHIKSLKSGFNQHQVTGDFICLNIEHVFAWFNGGPALLDILNILSVKWKPY